MYDFDKENTIFNTDQRGADTDFVMDTNQERTYSYKTPEERVIYEAQIPTRIRPFLTLHKESLGEEIEAAKQLTTTEYLELFKGSWEHHARACDSIDDFFMDRLASKYPQWSLTEIETVQSLFVDAYETDRDKNIASGGVKDKIEASAKELAMKYGWTDDEMEICLTPSSPTFHVKYNLEHMKYLSMDDGEEKQALLKYLTNQYHHNSEDFLNARLSHMSFYSVDASVLAGLVESTEKSIEKSAQKKTDFLKDYPEAKAIDGLIVFDNWQEYLYAYTQRAFPDLYLREEILNQASLLGIKTNNEALSYNNKGILEILERMKEVIDDRFSLPVQTYHQTTTSCGTSCVMTIAHNDIAHSRNNEYRLWRRVGSPYNFPGGLGILLKELHFEVVYTVNRDQHFIPGEYPVYDYLVNEEAQQIIPQYTSLHDKATEQGMETSIDNTTFSDIIAGLKQGWFSIIGIHMPNNEHLLHWVVANGYTKQQDGTYKLEISDPLDYFQSMNEGDYQELTDTYMGRRILFVNKNQTQS